MSEEAARAAFNMKVLKRHDPTIVEIVGSAAFVVLYEHDDEWTKLGIEGPMFLYRRSTTPSYGFFVLNRNGVENFSANLTPADDLELTSDFIIYRASPGEQVLGIWVYDAKERHSIGDSMVNFHAASSDTTSATASQHGSGPSSSSASASIGQQSSVGGQPISLDTLFGSSPSANTAAVPAAQAALSGPALLNSIFQSASHRPPPSALSQTPTPAPKHAPASSRLDVNSSAQGGASNADGLKALLGLPSAPVQQSSASLASPSASSQSLVAQPPQGLETIFASARISPHAANQTAANLPPKPATQTDATQRASEPTFATAASYSLDESLAQRPQANNVMDRREFVREVLSLIHTDKDFVDVLYQRYLTRVR